MRSRARRRPALVPGVWPSSTHDLAAAREHVLPQLRPYLKDLPMLADTGYYGANVHVPVRKPPGCRELAPDAQTRNMLLCSVRD